MKLCILTPSFLGGGAEKVAVNLANQYANEGIEVTVIALKSIGTYRSMLSDKVKLVDLGVSRARYAIFRIRKAIALESPTHLISVIRDVNILVGLFCKRPPGTVFAYREANTMNALQNKSKLSRSVYIGLLKLAYRKANVVIANSNDTKSDLIKYKIVRKDKIKVIGNPVISDEFKQKFGEDVSHPWYDALGSVIINVGRLHPQKNQQLLIDAFSRVVEHHPDSKLIILGDGAEKKRLLERINRLGLNGSVDLVPFKENPYPYYRKSSLFVLTSDWEGFGNVLVEALASGTPVIATDCSGGPREILADGRFGKLVPVGDVVGLADAIIDELNFPDRWSRDVLTGRGQEYTAEAVAAEYLKVICE